MFRPHMCPSSGVCVTKYRYIEVLQKFLNQFADIKKRTVVFSMYLPVITHSLSMAKSVSDTSSWCTVCII
jgi:hypothetical protein